MFKVIEIRRGIGSTEHAVNIKRFPVDFPFQNAVTVQFEKYLRLQCVLLPLQPYQ